MEPPDDFDDNGFAQEVIAIRGGASPSCNVSLNVSGKYVQIISAQIQTAQKKGRQTIWNRYNK